MFDVAQVNVGFQRPVYLTLAGQSTITKFTNQLIRFDLNAIRRRHRRNWSDSFIRQNKYSNFRKLEINQLTSLKIVKLPNNAKICPLSGKAMFKPQTAPVNKLMDLQLKLFD